MNVIDRNMNMNNKQIQTISNSINNALSLPNKQPKQIKTIPSLPKKRLISYKKNLPYSLEYATKNNIPARSSYHDDLINTLQINNKTDDDNIHVVLTHNYPEPSFAKDQKRIIEMVKPKNSVSGITDKNLMSHIFPQTSLMSKAIPKNNIQSLDTLRHPDTTKLPPIVTPVTTIKERMIVMK